MSRSPLYDCFVLMPHGGRGEYERKESEAEFIYTKIIRPAVESAIGKIDEKVFVHREIDETRAGAITRSIVLKIAKADLIIADITGSNANVFLELGIRYTLKKSSTILMRQERTPIPFDIGNHRCIGYDPFRTEVAVGKLSDAIVASQREPKDRPDSPVYEALPNLEVANSEAAEPLMPWASYWAKLNAIRNKLQEAKKDGRYNPDIVVGITNGGVVVADLLLLNREYDCPMVSLWADRKNMQAIFENQLNISTVKGIVDYVSKPGHDTRILLVDDYISSANTSHQATSFILKYIPGCHVRFLPLLYREERNLRSIYKQIVWRHHGFDYDSESINQLHQVNWHKFPYEKDIRAS